LTLPMKILMFVIPFLFFLTSETLPQGDSLSVVNYLPGVKVFDISGDAKSIWVASNGNGIFRFDKKNGKWKNYSSDDNSLNYDFFYCIDTDDSYVYAGSTDGLFILDKKRERWSKRKFGQGGQLSNWIRAVKYDKVDDVVWIGRFKYLSRLDIKKRRFNDYDLTVDGNKKTNTIKAIAVDGDSLVWFGTEGGMHKYDKSRNIDDSSAVIFYDNKLNYFHGEGETISISALLFEQNNLWIGLEEFITETRPEFNLGGLYKFNRRNDWIKFDVTNGLPGNGIYDIERTGNYIWVSCYQFGERTKEFYGRGLAVINSLEEKVIHINDDKIPATVYTIYYDGKNLWLGSDNGVYVIDLTNTLAKW